MKNGFGLEHLARRAGAFLTDLHGDESGATKDEVIGFVMIAIPIILLLMTFKDQIVQGVQKAAQDVNISGRDSPSVN